MQAKLFFSLALLAVASASLYRNEKYITVNHDGSVCQIVSENGFKIDLIKNKHVGSHGLKTFEVILQGPDFHKTHHIENQIGGDVLCDLCVRHQGEIDDTTYERILYKIEEYVRQGDLHPKVFYMFKCLHDREARHHLINDEVYGDDHYFGLYGKHFEGPYVGYYGRKFYEHKYGPFEGNYYGKHFYPHYLSGKHYYPHSYYNHEGDCQRCWAIGDVNGITGKFGPCVCHTEYDSFRTHVPYGARHYGVGRFELEKHLEKELERKVEREVETEVDERLENQVVTKHYGYPYGYQHHVTNYYGERFPHYEKDFSFNRFWFPKTFGVNHYGHHGIFGDYYGRHYY